MQQKQCMQQNYTIRRELSFPRFLGRRPTITDDDNDDESSAAHHFNANTPSGRISFDSSHCGDEMVDTLPKTGDRVVVITTSLFRYEGLFDKVNRSRNSITLTQVRAFGTEDRVSSVYVPGSDQLYDEVKFKASDIKEIVLVVGKTRPLHADPAIVSVKASSRSPQKRSQSHNNNNNNNFTSGDSNNNNNNSTNAASNSSNYNHPYHSHSDASDHAYGYPSRGYRGSGGGYNKGYVSSSHDGYRNTMGYSRGNLHYRNPASNNPVMVRPRTASNYNRSPQGGYHRQSGPSYGVRGGQPTWSKPGFQRVNDSSSYRHPLGPPSSYRGNSGRPMGPPGPGLPRGVPRDAGVVGTGRHGGAGVPSMWYKRSRQPSEGVFPQRHPGMTVNTYEEYDFEKALEEFNQLDDSTKESPSKAASPIKGGDDGTTLAATTTTATTTTTVAPAYDKEKSFFDNLKQDIEVYPSSRRGSVASAPQSPVSKATLGPNSGRNYRSQLNEHLVETFGEETVASLYYSGGDRRPERPTYYNNNNAHYGRENNNNNSSGKFDNRTPTAPGYRGAYPTFINRPRMNVYPAYMGGPAFRRSNSFTS